MGSSLLALLRRDGRQQEQKYGNPLVGCFCSSTDEIIMA